MAFLIDTNVISETLEPHPETRVLDWLGAQKPNDLFLASMSLGELVRGARRAKDKMKSERFKRWIDHDLAAPIAGARRSSRGRAATVVHQEAALRGRKTQENRSRWLSFSFICLAGGRERRRSRSCSSMSVR